MNKTKFDTKRIVGIAVFAALAYGVTFVFRIPVSFLTFDAKDAILTMAAFIYGPVSAVIMSLLTALIEYATISDTGFYGALMNFVSSSAFSFTASLIYKYRRTLTGAIVGLYISVAVTTGVMALMNILIVPLYKGYPVDAVIALLPALIVPFNLAKALMNAAIVLLIYKPVATALRRARLVDGKPMQTKFGKQSIITIIVGALSLAAAIVVFVILKA